jgi:hypothetical protein
MRKNLAREKFIELAEKRVTRTLKDIKLVGNLANRSNYSYTPEDAEKIVRVLRKAVDELKTKFDHKGIESDVVFKL